MKFLNILLEEISEVQKPEIDHEDNQGDIFLENNRQFCMRTKHTDIRHYSVRGAVKEKDTDINYIRSKENPAKIMMNNCSESGHANHAKILQKEESESWWKLEGKISIIMDS